MDENRPHQSHQPQLTDTLTHRQLELIRHYTDPASPGYRNATRSASLAGYAGEPGSNQLSVQGSRTLNKVRKLGMLTTILNATGCSIEHAAERLASCLDATRKRVFITRDGDIVEGPTEDDFREQRQAAKLVFQLHGVLNSKSGHQQPSVANEPDAVRDHQEQPHEEYRQALAIVAGCDPADREALRDVLECDAKSTEFQAHELHGGTAEQSGQDGMAGGDPTEA